MFQVCKLEIHNNVIIVSAKIIFKTSVKKSYNSQQFQLLHGIISYDDIWVVPRHEDQGAPVLDSWCKTKDSIDEEKEWHQHIWASESKN